MGAKLGWGELVVILIIALVVVGPDKLPKLGRALGKTVKGVKKYIREVTDELDATEEVREIRRDLEDIRRDVSSMGEKIEQSVTEDLNKTGEEIRAAERELNDALEDRPKQEKAPAAEEEPAGEPADETDGTASSQPAQDVETVIKEEN